MFADYINFFKSIFLNLPFNLFDYGVFALFILYVFEDISFGLVASGISLASTFFSFFIGLAIYPYLSKMLSQLFSLPKGISDAVSFLVAASVAFLIVSFLLSIFRKRYDIITLPKIIDKIGGAVFGSISFFFIASFAVALLLAFPTSTTIRNAIKDSKSAQLFSGNTQGIDRNVRKVFGGAIEDTINFLTVEPDSNQSIKLNFKTDKFTVDSESENNMLNLVNRARRSEGLSSLDMDYTLNVLARNYAKTMLSRGYFSHYTPEGLSPFDRMASAGINYQFAGENLAFAPDTEIAMNGLMKSPGHRENILNKNFRKVGIGVIDAGIYGKMFVQEFTD